MLVIGPGMSEKVGPTERHKYHHQGQLVYEWDQTLADISLYVQVPPGVRAKDLQVDIKADSVAFGLRGSPPFLSVRNPACRYLSSGLRQTCDLVQRMLRYSPPHLCLPRASVTLPTYPADRVLTLGLTS